LPAAVLNIFDATDRDRIFTEDLLNALVGQADDGPWPSWWERELKAGNTKGPASKLAYLLKRYEISPQTIREGDETLRGYWRRDFDEAWRRYLPPKDATTQQIGG